MYLAVIVMCSETRRVFLYREGPARVWSTPHRFIKKPPTSQKALNSLYSEIFTSVFSSPDDNMQVLESAELSLVILNSDNSFGCKYEIPDALPWDVDEILNNLETDSVTRYMVKRHYKLIKHFSNIDVEVNTQDVPSFAYSPTD